MLPDRLLIPFCFGPSLSTGAGGAICTRGSMECVAIAADLWPGITLRLRFSQRHLALLRSLRRRARGCTRAPSDPGVCTVTGRAPPDATHLVPWQSCLPRMDSAQRKQLKENGFLIVKDVLSPSTVARLNAIFVSAFGAPLSELSEPAPASSETLAPAGRTGNCGRRSLQVRCPGTSTANETTCSPTAAYLLVGSGPTS